MMKKILVSLALSIGIISPMKARQSITISTNTIQLTLQVGDDGRLYQAYFGERLSKTVNADMLAMPRANTSSGSHDGNEAYPVMGTEDYYEPAMEITHADGNPTTVLRYKKHQTRNVGNGVETMITLQDDIYPVTVNLHYLAYADNDIIKQWTEISHQEKGDVYLSRYASAMLYMEAPRYYLTEFANDWAKEMQMTTEQLQYGKKIIDTRLGARSSMLTPAFFELGIGSPADEKHGTVLMGTIGWTGNFNFTFEVDHNNELRILAGINPDASRYKLKRGEVFTTPEFIYTLSHNGTGNGSRNFQRWALDNQLYKGHESRYTLLNNWENTAFDFNQDKLVGLFGEAKDLGVDIFLLDDGWFGNKYPRNNDTQGLGDWEVTHDKLPDGIPFLVKKAEEAGVGFGIWVEPEMVSPKSKLAEKHPDWIISLPSRKQYYFRNQLVLDLPNPKVQDYVFGVIDKLMTENPDIKFIKWDCNSPITNIYSPYEGKNQGNLYIDYVRGLYNVCQRIQRKYPDLDMMLCSGGGGRCDFEALKYFTEFWCSDDTDPIERLYIQWGYSQFLPAKAMCAHVTNWNQRASVKFRVDVAFPYKLGFDINLQTLSNEDKEYCKLVLKEYNRLKDVIWSPNLHRLVSPYETSHCVTQRVSDDKSHALVYAYDMHPRFDEPLLPTKLEGLDAAANYRVREICLIPGKQSWLNCNDKVYPGDYLMKVGVKVLSSNDMTSHIIEITKE